MLSCCLCDESDSIRRCLAAKLPAAAFYAPANALIYATLCTLCGKNDRVDVSILAEELKTSGKLDAVGGIAFLMQISGLEPTTVKVQYWLDAVRGHYIRREFLRDAKLTIERASDSAVPLAELIEATQDRIKRTSNLATGQPDALDAISAAELCAKPPETPSQIVHGMLYRGGTGMLSAPSKGHKTYTAIDAAICICVGRDWLGFQTAQTSVLYVNLELSAHSMQKRIAAICAAHGEKPPTNLHFLNLRGRHVRAETLRNVIVPRATSLGVGLIIIDPYYKISSISGVEENGNDAQAIFLAQVEDAAMDAKCAILAVHHFAKGDAGSKNSIDRHSGGGVLARWPDVVATLTEHETEDCMVAEFHLRDFAPIPAFVVRWACPVWIREDGEDPAKVKRAGRSDDHPAAELLAKLDPAGMSNAEWYKASGWTDSTYRRKRDELERNGKAKQMMNVWKPC